MGLPSVRNEDPITDHRFQPHGYLVFLSAHRVENQLPCAMRELRRQKGSYRLYRPAL